MKKVRSGVWVIALSVTLMGPVYADDLFGNLPDREISVDGSNGHASTDKTEGEFNRVDGNINTIAKAVDANTHAISDMKTDVQQAKDLAGQAVSTAASAASSAAAAATSAAQSAETVNKFQDTITDVQSSVSKVQDQVTGLEDKIGEASSNAQTAKNEAASAVSTANQAKTDMETYRDQTTERVNEFENTVNTNIKNFEGTVNTNLGVLSNEIKSVDNKIQGAKDASERAETIATNANIKSDEALKVANRAESKIDGVIEQAQAYTDSKFRDIDAQISKVKKFAAAGTASALAASQIPQVSQGSAFSLGVGMGTYGGQSAISLGMSARLGDYTVTKLALTTDSMSTVGAGVGIAVEW